MDIQVLSVSVEDRLPRGLAAEVDVNELLRDGFSDAVATASHGGDAATQACTVVLWGRTADGASVAVRVPGVRPRLFFHMNTDDEGEITLASLRDELEREVMSHLRGGRIDVAETAFCHFCGYEPDATTPSGRVEHRYAVASYPSLSSWRRALRLRREQELRDEHKRLRDLRHEVSSLSTETPIAERRSLETRLSDAETRFAVVSEGWADVLNDSNDAVTNENAHAPRVAQEWFVDPITRFFQESGVRPSRWTRISSVRYVPVRITTCTHEIEATTNELMSLSERDDVAPYVTAYFDIETLGLEPEHFPVVQISVVVVRSGVHGYKRKYLLCTSRHDPIDGVIVREAVSEADLLMSFRHVIVEEDPDFVVSYNGVNFDNRFLRVRADLYRLGEFFYLSRYALHKCSLRELSLSSSGMGDNLLRFFAMPGRSNLDWYVKLKRDLTQEDSYSLDHMCKRFCGTKKLELASGLSWRRVSETIVCDAEYELTHLSKLSKHLTVAQHVLSQEDWLRLSDGGVDLCEHHWIRGADGTSRYRPVNTKHRAIADLYRGTPRDRARLGFYCVKDSDLLHDLDCARAMTLEILQFAGVFCIIPEWVYFRGQQVRFVSQLLQKVRVVEATPLLLQRPPDGFSGEGSRGFVGATVNEPLRGFHRDPVAVLDWKSLYPSIMMSHNLCHSTWVRDPKYHAMAGVVRHDVSDAFVTRFVSADVHRGILPLILDELMTERSNAKTMIKQCLARVRTCTDEAERTRLTLLSKVWDGRQLAIKVAMNSIYGACGTSVEAGAKFPCLAISATVTYEGRKAMDIKKELLPKHFPGVVVVYGDTDSVMLKFKDADDVAACSVRAHEAARIVTHHFVEVLKLVKMELEFEKVFWPYLLENKKRYVGMKYEPDGMGGMSCKGIDAKGVETERRDTLPFVKDIFYDVRDALMIEMDEREALRRFCVHMDALVQDRVPMERLTLRKNLSRKVEHKTSTIVQARVNQLRRLREAGSEASVNEQVEYVIVNGHKNAKTTELAEDPVYAREHGLRLNRQWYFEHCIREAMRKVFEVFDDTGYASLCAQYSQKLNAARLGVNSDALRAMLKRSRD